MSRPTEAEFLKRVKDHELTVLRDDGLYRHLRFRNPANGGIDGFDFVTWPGYLCYCGDMGEYVFSRIDDMLDFFRWGTKDAQLRINESYWAEKVQAADRDGVTEFSAELAQEVIRGWPADDATPELMAAVEELIASIPWDECGEETVRRAVDEFSFREPGETHPHDGWYFADFGEADLTDWTYRFIFCCYALAWGVRKYDAREPVA